MGVLMVEQKKNDINKMSKTILWMLVILFFFILGGYLLTTSLT